MANGSGKPPGLSASQSTFFSAQAAEVTKSDSTSRDFARVQSTPALKTAHDARLSAVGDANASSDAAKLELWTRPLEKEEEIWKGGQRRYGATEDDPPPKTTAGGQRLDLPEPHVNGLALGTEAKAGSAQKPLALASCGISTIVGCLETGRPQVLTYDLRMLTNLGGILNMWSRGTIFRDQYALKWYFFVHFASLCVCSSLVMVSVSDFNTFSTDTVEEIVRYLNFMVPLVLGLYLGVSLDRWWQLRVIAIGRLCNAAHDITQQVASFLPDETEVIARVRRWSMASVSLVMLALRDKSDLSYMLHTEQLEAREAESLQGIALYGRAMAMWSWILRAANDAMVASYGPEPHSNQVYLMFNVGMEARDSVQRMYTFLKTPLPFAYVHVVALLVDAMVCVITVKCSCVCMKLYHEEPINYQRMAYELVAFVCLPLLYHGLMSVTIEISDPFGDDMADFPFSWYQRWHQEHLDAAMYGMKHFPWQEWELLSGKPQSPEAMLLAAGEDEEIHDAHAPHVHEKEVEEESRKAADKAATRILKDATIEVTVHVKRALKGVEKELRDLQAEVDRAAELRAADSDSLLEKLTSKPKKGG